MKIAIVGCGNMGMAFARSFLQYDLVKKENLLLIEKSQERSEALRTAKEGMVVSVINSLFRMLACLYQRLVSIISRG